ncbi:nucleoside triphosphate pyrophosphohydrolase family protein [Zavarzinia compransoris]|uniref:nucleoside triphosphate pyrophosphohydrolase family protein n=1 Tax=Zavarzinia marina TaxID=2911065 RepID=UPI001F16801A|nr:nucleoside triphosphate pyrophosphohydrolase family protein [Zavarzinia marina]MCF4164716.1 nucleoside triphosphate pyrophosphohydrolase family protein [Zavarzinia marina]
MKRDTTLADYQAFARTTAVYPAERRLEYLGLGLASEAGEVAGVVKKWIRDGTSEDELRARLAAEMGDVCWYLAELCSAAGLDLGDVFAANMRKLQDRMDRGVIKGGGDHR